MNEHVLHERDKKMLLCKSLFCFFTDTSPNWIAFKTKFLDRK